MKITKNELIKMALREQMRVWNAERQAVENNPENPLAVSREKVAYEKLEELRRMAGLFPTKAIK